MGLFKSNEEKTQEYMEHFGLTELSEKDAEAIRSICVNSVSNGLFGASMILSGVTAADHKTVGLLETIVSQNWIIIRQLDRLNQKKTSGE